MSRSPVNVFGWPPSYVFPGYLSRHPTAAEIRASFPWHLIDKRWHYVVMLPDGRVLASVINIRPSVRGGFYDYRNGGELCGPPSPERWDTGQPCEAWDWLHFNPFPDPLPFTWLICRDIGPEPDPHIPKWWESAELCVIWHGAVGRKLLKIPKRVPIPPVNTWEVFQVTEPGEYGFSHKVKSLRTGLLDEVGHSELARAICPSTPAEVAALFHGEDEPPSGEWVACRPPLFSFQRSTRRPKLRGGKKRARLARIRDGFLACGRALPEVLR